MPSKNTSSRHTPLSKSSGRKRTGNARTINRPLSRVAPVVRRAPASTTTPTEQRQPVNPFDEKTLSVSDQALNQVAQSAESAKAQAEQHEQWQQVSFFEVSEHQEGQRIDNFLITRLKGVPKSRIYRLIRENEVRVNKGRVKSDYRLNTGDVVRVAPVRRNVSQPAETNALISDHMAAGIASRIIYQDDGLIVLDKPAGIAVHGGSGVDFGVIETLRKALNKPYLELVHRIDRDTSGLLMISQKRSVLKRLQDDLREGRIQKTYVAILKGQVLFDQQNVEGSLLRYELANGERRVKVSDDGKPSKTQFKVVQRFGSATLVEAKPFTGRTHQIRVHALSIGHPLVGDDKYGHERAYTGTPARRLCLHASKLEIPDYATIICDLPADMKTLLLQLDKSNPAV